MSNEMPPLPSDIDGIWGWANALSDRVQEVAKIKAERRRQRRNANARLRRPINKQMGLVRKKKEIQEPAERLEYTPEGCTCFLGHPPCSWCMEVNPDSESGEREVCDGDI